MKTVSMIIYIESMRHSNFCRNIAELQVLQVLFDANQNFCHYKLEILPQPILNYIELIWLLLFYIETFLFIYFKWIISTNYNQLSFYKAFKWFCLLNHLLYPFHTSFYPLFIIYHYLPFNHYHQIASISLLISTITYLLFLIYILVNNIYYLLSTSFIYFFLSIICILLYIRLV